MKKEMSTQVHYIPSRVYMQIHYIQRCVYRTHALSQKESYVHVGKLSFGTWYLVHGIWSEVLTLGIESKVLVLRGFGPWY